MSCLADDEITPTAHDAHGLLFDQCGLGLLIVGVDRHDATLGLGDHLLRDDEHIARGQGGSVGHLRCQRARHHTGEVGPGGDLTDAAQRNERDVVSHGRRSPGEPGRPPSRGSP